MCRLLWRVRQCPARRVPVLGCTQLPPVLPSRDLGPLHPFVYPSALGHTVHTRLRPGHPLKPTPRLLCHPHRHNPGRPWRHRYLQVLAVRRGPCVWRFRRIGDGRIDRFNSRSIPRCAEHWQCASLFWGSGVSYSAYHAPRSLHVSIHEHWNSVLTASSQHRILRVSSCDPCRLLRARHRVPPWSRALHSVRCDSSAAAGRCGVQ
mmetsp:Transcript_38363/g.62178  ORF Transcript_38363/g.62178 Transcript_38363/m.62178 type:complete len:205 (+) Transcript_38363:698-1312(+)